MGTIVVTVIIVLMTCLAICSLIRNKKKGISIHCGGDCRSCAGHCETSEGKKEKKKQEM